MVRIGNMWKFVPYARFFEDEILKLRFAFDDMIDKLKQIAKNEDELAYIEYFQKLKLAFVKRKKKRL